MDFIEKSWDNTDPDIREILNKRLDSGNDNSFYVFNAENVKQKLNFWNANFPRAKPFFAMKANHSDAAIRTITHLGTGFDCASKNEIERILNIGVPPDKIIFANPAKQLSFIRFAQARGVAKMTFDNVDELIKISSVYPAAKLVLRIRFDAIKALVKLGEKFGCDPNREACELIKLCKEMKMNLIGISFHGGSSLEEPAVFRNAIHAMKKLLDYAASIGMKLYFIDVGGGFSGSDMELVKKCANYLNEAIDECFPDPSFEIISEPGRFFMYSSMKLVCQAHSRKIQRNDSGEITTINYYLNDGLYSSFLAVIIFKLRFECRFFHGNLKKQNSALQHHSVFWGQTCDSIDRIFEQKLPELAIGDWVIFEGMGAYRFCRAAEFNGFSIPHVIPIKCCIIGQDCKFCSNLTFGKLDY